MQFIQSVLETQMNCVDETKILYDESRIVFYSDVFYRMYLKDVENNEKKND